MNGKKINPDKLGSYGTLDEFIENVKKAAEGMKKPVVLRFDDEVGVFDLHVPEPKFDIRLPGEDDEDRS